MTLESSALRIPWKVDAWISLTFRPPSLLPPTKKSLAMESLSTSRTSPPFVDSKPRPSRVFPRVSWHLLLAPSAMPKSTSCVTQTGPGVWAFPSCGGRSQVLRRASVHPEFAPGWRATASAKWSALERFRPRDTNDADRTSGVPISGDSLLTALHAPFLGAVCRSLVGEPDLCVASQRDSTILRWFAKKTSGLLVRNSRKLRFSTALGRMVSVTDDSRA